MGSTSYDEARDPQDPNDPTWSGASWYGPSTGEYWIINPREYADPRKHGPEYQSRARRMAAAAALGEEGADVDAEAAIGGIDPASSAEDAAGPGPTGGPREREAPRADAPRADAPTAGGEAAWTFRTGSPAEARSAARQRRGTGSGTATATAGARTANGGARTSRATRPSRPVRPTAGPAGEVTDASWGAAWPSDARSMRGRAGTRRIGPTPRDLVGGATDDPVRRLGVALVAWPPVGLAAAALIGDVTGCAVYSAACGGTEPLLPWLAQAAILGLLLLLPPIARLLAGGAIGVLVALVPLTALLVAVGGAGAPQAGFALSFLLGIAWLVGVAWALAHTRRHGLPRAAT